MGYEVHVLAPYSFYNEDVNTKYQVEDRLKECKKGREEAVKALYKLAYMTDPRPFMDKDYKGSPRRTRTRSFAESDAARGCRTCFTSSRTARNRRGGSWTTRPRRNP